MTRHIPLLVVLGCQLAGWSCMASAQSDVAAPELKLKLAGDDQTAGDGDSPLRVTLAHEANYKWQAPEGLIKNRASLQLEYSKYLLDDFFVQFNGKSTAFLGSDHRRGVERSDTQVSQAYVQTSFGKTSVRAGIQALPWGESILAPVTDEVSPRDNRELFNFNLEELRVGQAMVVVDQFADSGRWSAFYTPHPTFNKNPERGSAYYFDPFTYRREVTGSRGGEYGTSWRKNFESADVTLMAASLLDNDYAVSLDATGAATRSRQRFTLFGMVANYAFKDFVLRGEMARKNGKSFNNSAMQLLRKDEVDSYVALDYKYSPTLSFSVEAVNQHISAWDSSVVGFPRNRQSLLLSLTKTLMNDDLSINVMHIRNRPYASDLSVMLASFKWDDHVTLGLNLAYPHATDLRSGLWNVRDQKQLGFKLRYQY